MIWNSVQLGSSQGFSQSPHQPPSSPWVKLLTARMVPFQGLGPLRQHTKVISQLGSLGTWTKVLQLLGKMRSMRVQPNVITYNSSFSDLPGSLRSCDIFVIFGCCIHACGRSSVWQHALALLDEMKQASLQPDNISYNSCISACEFAAGQKAFAAQLVAEMRKASLDADLVTFNASISSCEKVSDWEGALQNLTTMDSSYIQADVVTYGASISACEKGAQWMFALLLLEDMAERRLQSNVVVQTAAISACAKSSKWQTALCILKRMEAKDLLGDVIAHSATINACKKGAAWEEALELLRGRLICGTFVLAIEEREPPNGREPCFFSANCKGGITRRKSLGVSRRFLEPNLIAFAASISACDKGSLWQQAMQHLSELTDRGFEADAIIWNSCISACKKGSQGQLAAQLGKDPQADVEHWTHWSLQLPPKVVV
eukprot:s3065_g6.t3